LQTLPYLSVNSLFNNCNYNPWICIYCESKWSLYWTQCVGKAQALLGFTCLTLLVRFTKNFTCGGYQMPTAQADISIDMAFLHEIVCIAMY